jgi:uncharacterized protein (TIGR03083 family)
VAKLKRVVTVEGKAFPMSVPVRALRSSHELLVSLASTLDDAGATRMSYCSEWTIAQVYSHLGSGAEISLEWLKAAREHTDPIGQDAMQAIWDRWDARGPAEQVAEAVRADARLVEAFEAMSAEELAAAHITLFGGAIELDGEGLALFRLPEHAVHTWDVAVALDPSARVAPYAVDLLIDSLPGRIGWMAKPSGARWSVRVGTTGPARTFVLAATPESVSLESGDSDQPDGVVRMPAEALLRLTFGRLDDSNAEGVDPSGAKVALADVRAVFPGF